MSARFLSILAALSLAVVALTFGALEWRYAHADDVPVLVAVGDPDPEAVIGPAGAVLFDAGPYRTAAMPTPVIADPAGAPVSPPAVLDAADDPGGALTGFRQWLEVYGAGYAVLFVIGSLLTAAAIRVPRLRKGKLAILVGTALAIVSTALAAKLAGSTDATVIMLALNIAFGGVMWIAKPNAATVDLSTATPEQIAEALAKAGPGAPVKVGV